MLTRLRFLIICVFLVTINSQHGQSSETSVINSKSFKKLILKPLEQDELTPSQLNLILDHSLEKIMADLLHYKLTRFEDVDSFLNFAMNVKYKNIDLQHLGGYMAKLMSYQIAPDEIIERALSRQVYEQWAIKKADEIHKTDPRHFVSQIATLNLKQEYKKRLTKVYALCVNAYRSKTDQAFMRKIEIGEPISGYSVAPSYTPVGSVKADTIYSLDLTSDQYEGMSDKQKAFHLLVANAQNIIEEQQLNDFHKACLAKCIADEAIQFVSAAKNIFLAARLLVRSSFRSGAANLQYPYGLCTNYAAITKAVAEKFGFGDRVQIHRRGKHFFNQFFIDGNWYHFHALRKYGKECRFIRYAH